MKQSEINLITIDGPAGSGKTTLAQMLSRELNIGYLDTGAMFRGIALYLGDNSWNLASEALEEQLMQITFELKGTGSNSRLIMNGQSLPAAIREEKVGIRASYLGQNYTVRKFLKKLQQDIGKTTSLVSEGRDMGTVVFPQADYKFFLDAGTKERAMRRWKQLSEQGQNPDFQEILSQLEQRDEQDKNRSTAPLTPASDAIIIDTTQLSQEQVFSRMLEHIQL